MTHRFFVLLLLLCLGSAPAAAQIRIDISAASSKPMPIAIDDIDQENQVDPAWKGTVDQTLRATLQLSGLFKLIKPETLLEPPEAGFELGSFKFEDWSAIGAVAVVKIRMASRPDNMLAAIK